MMLEPNATLILEVFTEELPPKSLPKLSDAFANAIWTASNADADAQVVYINAEYVSSNQNISFDQLLVVDSRVTADQSAADAAVLAFSA